MCSKSRPNPTSFKDIVDFWCCISNKCYLKYLCQSEQDFQQKSSHISSKVFPHHHWFWLLRQWRRFIAIVYETDKVLEAKSKIHHSQEVLKQFDLFRITLSSEPSLDFSAFFSSSWDCFTAFNSFSNCLHSILAWISCCHK